VTFAAPPQRPLLRPRVCVRSPARRASRKLLERMVEFVRLLYVLALTYPPPPPLCSFRVPALTDFGRIAVEFRGHEPIEYNQEQCRVKSFDGKQSLIRSFPSALPTIHTNPKCLSQSSKSDTLLLCVVCLSFQAKSGYALLCLKPACMHTAHTPRIHRAHHTTLHTYGGVSRSTQPTTLPQRPPQTNRRAAH